MPNHRRKPEPECPHRPRSRNGWRPKLGRGRLAGCAAILVWCVLHPVGAIQEPEVGLLQVFDARGQAGEQAARTIWSRSLGERGATEAARQELLGSVFGVSGRTSWTGGRGHALRCWTADASDGKAGVRVLDPARTDQWAEAALQWLAENAAVWGWDRTVADALVLERVRQSSVTGAIHLYFGQRLEGLPVLGAEFHLHFDANGALVSAYSGTFPLLKPAGKAPSAGAAPVEIMASALSALGDKRDPGFGLGAYDEAAGGWVHPDLTGAVEPEVVWFPTAHGAEPAWVMDMQEQWTGWNNMYQVVVGAGTGRLLARSTRTFYAEEPRGRVYQDSPARVEHEIVPWVHDPTASPLGWINQQQRRTIGNNCWAGVDAAGDNEYELIPEADASLLFDPPFGDHWSQTEGAVMDDGASASVNLFYWGNIVHDWLYSLGFDERSGNFQDKNFGRGGAGNDAIRLDAHDSANLQQRNNANFTPMPDGFQSRAQFYLFTDPPFVFRDSAFDPDVVVHELIHGLTTRMIGSAANFFCFEGVQSGGMAEGWSDFLANSFLDDGVMGEWVTGNAERGIRRFAFSSDMSVNPLTYADLCNEGCQVHRDGEIWGVTLWDLRDAMIERYGKEIGVPLTEQLVVEALSFTPCSPSFLDGRDALLAADLVMNGGGNQCMIWTVFARRGMGDLAESIGDGADVIPSFDLPCSCQTYTEPRFRVESVVFNDSRHGNANAVLEPAEVVELGITLQNLGAYAADPTVRAISRDPDLTVIEDLAFWPGLGCSAKSRSIAGEISVIADAGVVRDQVLHLELQIEYGTDGAMQVLPLELVVCPGSYEIVTDIPFDWQQVNPGIGYIGWDDMTYEVELGFSFPFYGQLYDRIHISTNGVIGFGSDPGMANMAQTLPDPAAPNNLVAPFWTDLNFEQGGKLVVRPTGPEGGRRFIIEWRDAAHYPSIGNVTFQAVLFEATGEILFQYQDVDFGNSEHDRGASASIGIEDRYGLNGLSHSYMEPMIEGGAAILIRPRACAAIVSPRAYLHWIERAVPCDGSATLELRDLDLAGVGSITLAMEYWAGGDPGRRPYGEIELTEVAPPSGVFTGAFSILDRPDMLPGDGDLIFALYEDTSTAGGPRALEAMLPVDCEPPSLIGTGLSLLEPERAVLTVRADENCYGTLLLYKDACPSAPGAEPWRSVEAVFVTSYSGQVTVGELLPGTRYFYQWLLRDLAGNEAIFDNDGICYEFSTEARTTAAFPFLEDFEREELAPYWRPQSYDEGRISITSRFEPYHGRKHLLMDDYLINSARSLNELTLTIDLEGQEDVSLRFYHKSLGDEPNGMPEQFDNHYNADGVAMSLDGRRWYRLVSLTPTEGVQSQYREFRVPLDPVLDRAFGSFHDRVQIRFQQYDNSPADQDGFAFDYIQVVPTDRTPPEFGGLHSVQPGQNSVRLSWFAATDPSLPIRYRVYMSSEPGQQNFQEPISETVGTIHEVKGLNAAQEYHFVVRAVDGDGNEDSNRVEFTASPLDSQPPVFLGLRSILGEAEGVRLGWIEALDGSMPILYEVYMGPSGAPVETYDMALQTTNVFGVVTGLPLDRPTCFMVRARDAAGNLDANTEVLCGAPVALLPQQPPIREGFESGELSDSWRILGTGRAAVTSGYGSAEGDQALLLDAPVAGTELLGSAAVLLADLAGATNVVLSFSYRNLGDEPHLLPDRFEEFALGDGVAISPDGIHWARVYSLAGGSDGLWRSVSFSLDRILSELEWTYTDRFRIGFFQADNAPAPQDGILFDAIVVREKDIVPPLFEGLQLASPLDSAARLSWEPAVETESLPVWYEIYRAYEQEELVYQTPIAFSDQTSVVVSNLSGTVSYRFAVRARDASGNVDTNEVERVVQPFDTIRPQFQGLQEVRSSDRALRLYWQAARDPSRPIYYDVYSVVDGTVGAKVYSTQASSAVISGLRNGKTYCFMVRARDGAGNLDLNDKVLCGIPTVESEDVVFVDAAADPSLADGTILHPFPRIADGLVAAALGAEIRIAEGRYPESLVLSTPVRISGGWRSDYSVWDPDFFTVTLTGGPDASPLLDIQATGLHCEGIRFSPADGQAIRVSGSVILERCRIAGIGGEPAIDVDGGQVTMLSVQLQGNGTQPGPIVQVDRGHLEMESVLLTGFSLRGGQPALLELANGATGGLRYVTAAGNLLGGGVVLRVGSGCYCTGLGLIFKGNLGASLDVLPDAVVEIDHAFLDPYRGTPVFGDGVDLETAPGYRAPGLGDYHLTADAPAVDVIPLAELAGDLPRAGADGLPRPFGDAMDAGAFEYRDVDGNGIPDDRDLDADGDGLPNHWERRLGLDWLRADAGEDYDGDGFDNASEFRAGTDPFDPASALRILELRPDADRDVLRLTWHAVAGHGYVVEWAAAVGEDWAVLSPTLHATIGQDRLEFETPLADMGTGLFRVRLVE
jgi:hypothetical protein